MFREVVILVCAVSIVCTSTIHSENSVVHIQSSTPSPALYEAHQVSGVLPTVASYSNISPPRNTYLPAKPAQFEVNSAVAKTLSAAHPVASKSVTVESDGPAYQQAAVYAANVASLPLSLTTQNIPVPVVTTYNRNAALVRPYYTVPVAAKTVTVESHGTVNAHPSSIYDDHQVGSAVVDAKNAAPIRPYYVVPVAPKTVSVESRGAVDAHPPAAYVNYPVSPAVTYINNAVPLRSYYPVPVAENTVAAGSYGPVAQPEPQYVPEPGITYAINPVVKTASVPFTSKTLTVEPYNSVTAYTTPAPAPAIVRYAPLPVPKPIPLPVVYQASGVETRHPAEQQFAVVTKTVAPTVQVRTNSIPVPLEYPTAVNSEGGVRYQSVPVPVVHAKSFVEKPFATVGPTPTPITPVGQEYEGYARAVAYSPASAVSRVTFNGLGVSYGW